MRVFFGPGFQYGPDPLLNNVEKTAILVGEGISYLESVLSLILRRICDTFVQGIARDVGDLPSAVCSHVRCMHFIVPQDPLFFARRMCKVCKKFVL